MSNHWLHMVKEILPTSRARVSILIGLVSGLVRICPGNLGGRGVEMISFGKIRPQIFMAIALLGAITGYAIYSDMVEIATGTVGAWWPLP